MMDSTLELRWYQRRRSRIALIVLLVAVCAGLSILLIQRSASPSFVADELVLDRVRPASETLSMGAGGELVRQRRLVITAPADGIVDLQRNLVGRVVPAGTAIASIENADLALQARAALTELKMEAAERSSDDSRLIAQLESQQLELERAMAEVEIARMKADGNKRLTEAGLISNVALSEHLAALRLAELKVGVERRKLAAVQQEYAASSEAARSKLGMMQDLADRAEQRVAELQIRAPFDGIVEKFEIEPGASITRGEPMLGFGSNSGMDAVVRVLERSASRVRVGMPAVIQVQGRKIAAEVVSIGQQVAGGVVEVVLRPSERVAGGLMAGQRIEASISVGQGEGALLVQRPAGVADGSTAVLLRKRAGTALLDAVAVRFGVGNETLIEVVDGLSEGQEIVVNDVGSVTLGKTYRIN